MPVITPDGTGTSGPLVTVYMDDTGRRMTRIEATSAEAVSRVLRDIADAEGPFGEDTIVEIIGSIDDANLSPIVERDLREINVCIKNHASKSVLLLCGGIIEAFIYNLLSGRRNDAQRYFNDLIRDRDPKKLDLDIEKWSLGEMLTVSEHLGLIKHDFVGKARDITSYRNIIHPSYEIRNEIVQIDRLAPISIELVKMLILPEDPG